MAGFTDSFPVRVKKEIEKIKSLKGFGQKASYIWEYYKFSIIMTIAIIFSCISITTAIINNNYNTVVDITYINYISDDLMNENVNFQPLLNEWFEIDGKKNRATIDGFYKIDPNSYTEETQASYTKLMARVTTKQCDIFLCDETFMDLYTKDAFFGDLKVLLPDDLYKAVEDRLIFYSNEYASSIAYGIDLSGLPFTTKVLGTSPDIKVIFSIMGNTTHIDNIIKVLENILNYEAQDI